MSKEHAYAYEAGYRDGAINYELEHCPACKNVADLQEALVENAKLRHDLEDANNQAEEVCIENAKLRELVRIMHSELVSCEDNGYICGGHKFDKRVSELGIEVDG